MKKITVRLLAVLMTAAMLLSMTGCTKKEEERPTLETSQEADPGKAKGEKPEKEESKEASEEVKEESSEAAEEASEAAPAMNGEQVTTELFSFFLPEDLIKDEDWSYEGSGYAYLYYASEDDSYGIDLKVYTEDSIDFRKSLIYAEFSLQDYAEGKVPVINIAGFDFVNYEYDDWGTPSCKYLYRVPEIGTTLEIDISNPNESTQAVLDSLTYTLPTGTQAEAPYPWEGTPIAGFGGSGTIGSYTLTATQLVMDESILPMTLYDNRVVTDGKYFYVLSEDQLYVYELNGTTLVTRNVYTLPADYSNMDVDAEGYVYLSEFIEPLQLFYDGQSVGELPDITDYVAMDPTGTIGLTYFMDWEDIEVFYADENGNIVMEPVEFIGSADIQEYYSEIFITENYIATPGSMLDTSKTEIPLYDYDGNLAMRLTAFDPDWGFGTVSGFLETENYFIALDALWETVTIWDKTGTCLGEVEMKDLFGVDYSYAYGFSKGLNGEFYVSLGAERPDGSWEEIIVYQLNIQ